GDVDGDGTPDMITAPGLGLAPLVRVFSGRDGSPLAGPGGAGVNGFPTTMTRGVVVATGDFTGDGLSDIGVSADAGGPTTVRIFSGATGQPLPGVLGSFAAFPTTVKGGIRIAVGDVNADGSPDIVTVPGAGTAAQVKVFSGRAGQGGLTPQLLR